MNTKEIINKLFGTRKENIVIDEETKAIYPMLWADVDEDDLLYFYTVGTANGKIAVHATFDDMKMKRFKAGIKRIIKPHTGIYKFMRICHKYDIVPQFELNRNTDEIVFLFPTDKLQTRVMDSSEFVKNVILEDGLNPCDLYRLPKIYDVDWKDRGCCANEILNSSPGPKRFMIQKIKNRLNIEYSVEIIKGENFIIKN